MTATLLPRWALAVLALFLAPCRLAGRLWWVVRHGWGARERIEELEAELGREHLLALRWAFQAEWRISALAALESEIAALRARVAELEER